AGKFWDLSWLHETRRRVGVRANFGGYVDILFQGNTWISTGSQASGPNYGKWPCAQANGTAPTLPDECEEYGGLFCDWVDCSDPTDRATMNDRLMNAAMVFDLTTQTGEERA